jgi:hypothetical protein
MSCQLYSCPNLDWLRTDALGPTYPCPHGRTSPFAGPARTVFQRPSRLVDLHAALLTVRGEWLLARSRSRPVASLMKRTAATRDRNFRSVSSRQVISLKAVEGRLIANCFAETGGRPLFPWVLMLLLYSDDLKIPQVSHRGHDAWVSA